MNNVEDGHLFALDSLAGSPSLSETEFIARTGRVSDWVAIEQWSECVRMERPGIVFEIRNRAGQSLFTPCVTPLPEMPFDWTSAPVEFRPVPEEPPRHSTPIPLPAARR